MAKITQKQLVAHLVDAFASGSVAQLKTVLKMGSSTQIKAVYHSNLWTKMVVQHSARLTPHKAYGFANAISNRFGLTEPFQVFMEHCAPLHTYISAVKLGEKPSVVATVQRWVRDSAVHAENVFVLLNDKLDPAVAKMDPCDFVDKNDVWWPSVSTSLMQTVATVQPDFVKEFQATVIERLRAARKLLGALTTGAKSDTPMGQAVSTVMGGARPHLFVLMRDHLQNILFNTSPDENVAHQIAVCVAQGEMYINLVGLQTWNNHLSLDDQKLINIHKVVTSLDVSVSEKISTYSEIHVSDFLNLCQSAYIKNQVGEISAPTNARKI